MYLQKKKACTNASVVETFFSCLKINLTLVPDGQVFPKPLKIPKLKNMLTIAFLCKGQKSYAKNAVRILGMSSMMDLDPQDCDIVSTPVLSALKKILIQSNLKTISNI